MNESTLTKKLARHIRDKGGWCRKTHGGPQAAGWPDLVGVYRGVFLGLEVKLPHKRGNLTKLQASVMAEIREAGGLARVVTSIVETNEALYEASIIARLMNRVKVNPETECWEWQKPNSQGYANITVKGRVVRAHRVAAALYSGFDLASPLYICHSCDNRRCCNPKHLFPGTASQNMQDMASKGRRRGIKLRVVDIPTIRERRQAGETLEAIGKDYGLTKQQVRNVATGYSWGWVP